MVSIASSGNIGWSVIGGHRRTSAASFGSSVNKNVKDNKYIIHNGVSEWVATWESKLTIELRPNSYGIRKAK